MHLASNTSDSHFLPSPYDEHLGGKGIATSPATLLKLPRGYTYLWGAPGTGTGKADRVRLNTAAHPYYDEFFLPPTSFRTPDPSYPVSKLFPRDILGIICIRHAAGEVPFVVIWGDTRQPYDNMWCKALSASEVQGWQGADPIGLPDHLFRSEVFGALVRGWRKGATRDSIDHSTSPNLADEVSVKKFRWRGCPGGSLYEIMVTSVKIL